MARSAHPAGDPVARSDALTTLIEQSDLTPESLYRYGRRNRRIARRARWWAILAALVALTVGWFFNHNQVRGAVAAEKHDRQLAQIAHDQAVANATVSYNECIEANSFRALDLQRWQYIESQIATPPTQEARLKLAQFEAYIAQTDAQKHCPPLSQFLQEPNPQLPGAIAPVPSTTTTTVTPPTRIIISPTPGPKGGANPTTQPGSTTTTTRPHQPGSTTTTTCVNIPTDGGICHHN